MSKGSWYRPVDQKKYAENYERIFGKKKKRNIVTILGMEIEYNACFPEEGMCLVVNPKSDFCQFCKRNPDATEIQTRFFCPVRGEPLDA